MAAWEDWAGKPARHKGGKIMQGDWDYSVKEEEIENDKQIRSGTF